MVISTDEMSRVHKLEDQVPRINANGEVLERVTLHKFLGVWIQDNLKWTEHVTKTVSSCFAALSAIKKIKTNWYSGLSVPSPYISGGIQVMDHLFGICLLFDILHLLWNLLFGVYCTEHFLGSSV